MQIIFGKDAITIKLYGINVKVTIDLGGGGGGR